MRVVRGLVGAVAAVTMAACVKPLEPLPLEVMIEASATTAAVGDSVDFIVKAQGGNLVGVAIDFGDASSDLFETAGARRAQVRFRHAYMGAGTFDVQTTVTDAVAGDKSASLQVAIN